MAKSSSEEYTIEASAGGVRVLQGEVVSLDVKSGVLLFKYKQFRKTKRVLETIPIESIVYLKEAAAPKAEVAYNSPGFPIAEFSKVTGVSEAGRGLYKGTTNKDETLYFNPRFSSLSTQVANTGKLAKAAKGEKKVNKVKKGAEKTKKSKGSKLPKKKW